MASPFRPPCSQPMRRGHSTRQSSVSATRRRLSTGLSLVLRPARERDRTDRRPRMQLARTHSPQLDHTQGLFPSLAEFDFLGSVHASGAGPGALRAAWEGSRAELTAPGAQEAERGARAAEGTAASSCKAAAPRGRPGDQPLSGLEHGAPHAHHSPDARSQAAPDVEEGHLRYHPRGTQAGACLALSVEASPFTLPNGG